MSMSKENQSVGCGVFSMSEMLFVVFLVLKLTHYIDWSWWWVTSPLWIGFALGLVLVIIICIINVILYWKYWK